MDLKKSSFCLSVLLCVGLSFTGCSKSISVDEETPYYSISIDGDRQYKSEENETVQELIQLGLSYVDLTCNINYKSQEHAFEEIDYYNESLRNEYVEFEYVESAIETAEYYEQVMELVDRKIIEIQFFELEDQERAWVACEYISKVTNATQEYLEAVGIELDTNYKRVMTLGFVKENGEWKISEYDITDREEVK